jgi:hypothetical protein
MGKFGLGPASKRKLDQNPISPAALCRDQSSGNGKLAPKIIVDCWRRDSTQIRLEVPTADHLPCALLTDDRSILRNHASLGHSRDRPAVTQNSFPTTFSPNVQINCG